MAETNTSFTVRKDKLKHRTKARLNLATVVRLCKLENVLYLVL